MYIYMNRIFQYIYINIRLNFYKILKDDFIVKLSKINVLLLKSE